MRLTTKGRFAVTAMIDLALRQNNGPVTLAAISQRQQISLSYLEQLFGKLRRHELVESTRGPGGGYTLARKAGEITVADIIVSVDEPIDATQCGGKENCLGEAGRCMTHELWASLNQRMVEFLDSVTLQKLVDEQLAKGVQIEDKPIVRLRLFGVDEAAGQQHFHRLLRLHVAHQRYAGRGAEQADVDAVDTKARRIRRHRQVALRHQLAASRRGQALHARDDGHRKFLDGQHHLAALREQALVVGQLRIGLHLLEVVAGAKGLALGGDDQHTRRRVGGNGIELALQFAQHRFAQHVEGLRAVQRQPVHATRVVLVQHQAVFALNGGCCHNIETMFLIAARACPSSAGGHFHAQTSASTRTCASTLRASADRL